MRSLPYFGILHLNIREKRHNLLGKCPLCNKLEATFEEAFFISNHKIICPAVIYEIHDIHMLPNIESLLSYIEFLAHKTQDIKHSFCIHDNSTLYEEFQKEQDIEHFLFTAVEKNLFDVWYQPIYSIKDQKYNYSCYIINMKIRTANTVK